MEHWPDTDFSKIFGIFKPKTTTQLIAAIIEQQPKMNMSKFFLFSFLES